MIKHFLKRPRRTMAAAGLILASAGGVLVATSNSAQAAVPGYPLTVCYASQSGNNPERRVLYGSVASEEKVGGSGSAGPIWVETNVGYWVQTESWSRSKGRYEYRSRTWVNRAERADVRQNANARCSHYTFRAFRFAG